MAWVAAELVGIGLADEAAIIKELARLDPKKVAIKMVPKVGSMLGELDPKWLAEGNLVMWRDGQNGAWRDDDSVHVISMPTEACPMQVKLAGKKTGYMYVVGQR